MNSFEELERRRRSFAFAWAGWRHVWGTQPNARIHAAVTTLVLSLALWLGLPRRDWAVLILAIATVWTAEFVNTAVEAVVDMAMPDPHPLARVAKDVAAGAVMIAALGAALVGLLLLGPPLLARLGLAGILGV